jgi:hypothetical protein
MGSDDATLTSQLLSEILMLPKIFEYAAPVQVCKLIDADDN